jgi:myosin heavy subunit
LGKVHSAQISNYLLEKSRICHQTGIERNFHIFYQVLSCASSHPLLKKYRLKTVHDYKYTN